MEIESEEENNFIIDIWNSSTLGKPIDKGPWIGGYRFSSTNNFQFWIWLVFIVFGLSGILTLASKFQGLLIFNI